MWDLVGNPEDRFSHNEAHFARIVKGTKRIGRQRKRWDDSIKDLIDHDFVNLSGASCSKYR